MKRLAICILVCVTATFAVAQRVGIGTTNPDSSAMLDVRSTSKGILIPRMSTAQRKAIANPEESLMVYDTTSGNFWYYNQGWKSLASNQMTGDSAYIIGIQSGNIPSYTMEYFEIVDSSAYLFDTGGPNGNYGNNENLYVQVDVPGFAVTRIQIINNNLEYPYDSLFIYTAEGVFNYVGNETDTLFTVDNFWVRFKSNSVNTQPGFVIRIDVYSDNSPSDGQNPPLSGIYFIPEKKALMGGFNLNHRWHPDSVGIYTFNYGLGNLVQGSYAAAIGTLNIAKGNGSFIAGSECLTTAYGAIALGDRTKATGNYAMAMGRYTTASGSISTAMGTGTIASGTYSTAMGELSQASGFLAMAMGANTKAIGTGSTAMGLRSIASGNFSTAIGADTKAFGFFAALATGYFSIAYASASSAFGHSTKAKSYSGMVVGSFNDSTDASGLNSLSTNTRLFQIGNGTADNLRSNAMTVLQNGNIGIGMTTPGFLLNFPSNHGNKISLWGSTGNHYGFGIQPALLQIHTDDSYSDVAFGHGSSDSFTETMRIKGNGNVGIGIIEPASILDIGGRVRIRNGTGGTAGIYLNKNDNSDALGFIGSYGNDNLIGMYGYTGADWGLVMNTTNGNIGFGTIAPTQKLHVIGNGLFSGTVTASCGVLVCSDIRYKKNIRPVANALTSILAIKGIYYDWDKEHFPEKAFNDERQIGCSAQELEQIIPEVVHTDSNGFKTVDYSRLTPVLVEAIKEQQKQIDELKEKIEWLMKNN